MRKKAIECIEIIDGNKEEKVLSEERNLNQLKKDNDNYSDNQKLIGRIIKEAEYI